MRRVIAPEEYDDFRIPACATIPTVAMCEHIRMEEWALGPPTAAWGAAVWVLPSLETHLLPELVRLVASYLELCAHCGLRPATGCVSRGSLGLPPCLRKDFCVEHHRVTQYQCLVHAYTRKPICVVCLALRRACPTFKSLVPLDMQHVWDACPRCSGPYCMVRSCNNRCGWCGLRIGPLMRLSMYLGDLAAAAWARLKVLTSRPCKRRRLTASPALQ